MGTTSSTASLSFNGISNYASDFQSILQTDMAVAQEPLTALQNSQTTIQNEDQELATISPDVASLGSAVAELGTVASSQGMSASSSDSSIVSAVVTGASSPATYTISNIQSLAAPASATSIQFTNADEQTVSDSGQVQLTVGTDPNPITLTLSAANNNLNGLVAAINSATDPTTGQSAGLTATLLTTSSGDYISISANSSGNNSIQLTTVPASSSDQAVNLLQSSTDGTDAQFTLNGSIPVQEATNTISDVIPGLSLTLNNTTTGSETISLAPDPSQLSSAIQSFVSAYNTVANDVTGQEGTSGGPLVGNSLIRNISEDMQQLAMYWNPSSSSSIRSLSDLGVTFNDSGQLSFNQDTFNALSSSQITDAFNFFGSANSGFAALASNFTQLSDPSTGLIAMQESDYQDQYTQLTNQISTLNTQISNYQTSITQQLQAADATCAELEQEQTNETAEIQAVDLVNYGPNPQVA